MAVKYDGCLLQCLFNRHLNAFKKGAMTTSSGMKALRLLNLNIHTSYFSHAVNYSHEYVTFWYV